MHSFQPQPRQQGGRTPSAEGTEPSPSLDLPFHLLETAGAVSPLLPLMSPRDPARRMVPTGCGQQDRCRQQDGCRQWGGCRQHLVRICPPPWVLWCKMHPREGRMLPAPIPWAVPHRR